MPLAARHHPGARLIDESFFVREKHGHQAAAPSHLGGRFDAARFEKRGAQVHQVHIVIDDAAAFDAGTSNGKRYAGAEVVEIALAVREARRAVVAADRDECVVQLTDSLQLREHNADGFVISLCLAKIVREVFANSGTSGRNAGTLPLNESGSMPQSALPEPRCHLRCVSVGPNQKQNGVPAGRAARKSSKLPASSSNISSLAAWIGMPFCTAAVTFSEKLLKRLPAF